MEQTKQSFKVRIEHTDSFGTKMSGESFLEISGGESPSQELIVLFEQAFEACGFSKGYIRDYYGCGKGENN